MLAAFWLTIRNLTAIALFPGIVVVYIPYRLLNGAAIPGPLDWSMSQYAAALVATIGAAIPCRSIWSFAFVGRGTLAPFDETQVLIVEGFYRFVRNPMYIAVMLILLAQSMFFWSTVLLSYAGICFVVANILVIGYEENRLRHKYGNEYRKYCEHVGRWIPGRPYHHGGSGIG